MTENKARVSGCIAGKSPYSAAEPTGFPRLARGFSAICRKFRSKYASKPQATLVWIYDRLTRKRACYLCTYCREPVYGMLIDHLDRCRAFRRHMNRVWQESFRTVRWP